MSLENSMMLILTVLTTTLQTVKPLEEECRQMNNVKLVMLLFEFVWSFQFKRQQFSSGCCALIFSPGVLWCLKPEDITNGAYHYVTDNRIEYTCNYGYQLDSGETANVFAKFCDNGAWSPATGPSCIGECSACCFSMTKPLTGNRCVVY